MAVDALEVVVVDGQLTFPNLPRLGNGEHDWSRLGGQPWRTRGGAVIDPRPTVPDPRPGENYGRPVRPT